MAQRSRSKSPTKTEHKDNQLTQEEAEVYDRQLRIWGIEAQQRMRGSRVLVAGMRATAAEICKNLVLTGIGSLVILDDQLVSGRDLPGQFFLTQESIGTNRAVASLAAVRRLNPHVTITADAEALSSKPDSFFSGFDAICLTDCNEATELRINRLCHARDRDIAFFAVSTLGLYGICHEDLGTHDFKVKQKVKKEEITVSRSARFPALVDVYETSFEEVMPVFKRRLKPFGALYVAIRAMARANVGEDAESAVAQCQALLERQGVGSSTVSAELLRNVYRSRGAQLSAVSAILGGLIAQEILKVLSGKDAPLKNVLVYDANQNSAVNVTVGG